MTSGAGAAYQVSREMFEAAVQLLDDHPELTPDRSRQLIESSERRRPRADQEGSRRMVRAQREVA